MCLKILVRPEGNPSSLLSLKNTKYKKIHHFSNLDNLFHACPLRTKLLKHARTKKEKTQNPWCFKTSEHCLTCNRQWRAWRPRRASRYRRPSPSPWQSTGWAQPASQSPLSLPPRPLSSATQQRALESWAKQGPGSRMPPTSMMQNQQLSGTTMSPSLPTNSTSTKSNSGFNPTKAIWKQWPGVLWGQWGVIWRGGACGVHRGEVIFRGCFLPVKLCFCFALLLLCFASQNDAKSISLSLTQLTFLLDWMNEIWGMREVGWTGCDWREPAVSGWMRRGCTFSSGT